MIAVLQRVRSARVVVAGETVGEIGRGLTVLACSVEDEREADVDWLADKIAEMRLFPDERGRAEHSLLDVGGGALVVPQFTLAADWRKGRRPSFLRAAPPELAAERVERLAQGLARRGLTVARGRFGADMAVELINEGPYTLVLDTAVRGTNAS